MSDFNIASDDARHIADALDRLQEAQNALDKIEGGLEFPIRVWSELVGMDGYIEMHDSGTLVFRPGGRRV
ncbi:hypothetical protein HOV03_gp86 [Gordonia phage Asapag]|uniref:Uncharacterized protein n=7 Tax=Caudoviricetes TaxID=2731619 RepID=A0A345L199_9CAUD|nr:hypothetical protein HOS44_gp092 [Gordonia phage BENtherdunthat]YP_009806940.1 hypothetical protein HOT72_gp092 [Gordonia phage Apricot]YP_009808330.1 hypothetical protein HOT93_gp057 [Gordonia phage Horus]YP_009808432.1 hypothetical protein HOT94_gp091 [Gordonia phage Phistory]YP_009818703.1 hypothetical protein HOU97_gp87 [Gordonia phage Kenna]YP_009819131.1 hypothetical protein HOV03_gp86 [Gordonia phage Asapag]QCG77250.1 hypothetical protein SEA_LUTUM_93 [Gordonia phage Lutum]QSL99844